MKKIITTIFIIIFLFNYIECKADKIDFDKDIEGLSYYILDDTLIVKWTDDFVNKVRITATDTSTADIYFDETTVNKEISIPVNDKNEIILSVGDIYSEAKQYIISTVYDPNAYIIFGNEEITNREYYTITAVLNEPYAVEYYCNNNLINKTERMVEGEHLIDVPLLSEKNNITAYIVDDAGNKKSFSAIIEKDITIPKLVLTSDYDATTTYNDSICLMGTISDYKMLFVNSKPVFAEADGSFSYEYKLVNGENYISIQGIDEAGNIAEYYAVVTKIIKTQKNRNFVLPIVIAIFILTLIFFVIRFIISKKSKSVQNEHENDTHDSKEEMVKYRKDMIKKGISFLTPVLIVVLLYTICFYGGTVKSTSMASSINKGEFILANKLSYIVKEPERGDVIVFYSQEFKEVFLKRIIGIEGDEITFIDGELFINGNICTESYLKPDIETNAACSFKVPKGTVFVLGDNRENSIDSRHWENPYIPIKDIYGKIIFHF